LGEKPWLGNEVEQQQPGVVGGVLVVTVSVCCVALAGHKGTSAADLACVCVYPKGKKFKINLKLVGFAKLNPKL
jgi:hypothetical protein